MGAFDEAAWAADMARFDDLGRVKTPRWLRCRQAGVPIANYGLTIAYALGIFERALEPFPAALETYHELRPAHAGR